MKTKIKKAVLAVFAALFVSTVAFAFEDSVKVNENNSVSLMVSKINSSTHITFKDKRSNILYKHTIDSSLRFAKTFDLELLPKGVYRIEIENSIKTKVIPLNIDNSGINLVNSGQREYFKAFVNEKGSLVYVTQFSPDGNPLYVAIFNDKDQMILEDRLEGKLDLGKIYDFSKSVPGEYRIFLKSNGSTSNHIVYVD